jgi:hypothetical protein
MSYDGGRKLTKQQIIMLQGAPAGNSTSNRAVARYTTSNYFWNTSTNAQPWFFNVKKGDVIPRPLKNDN